MFYISTREGNYFQNQTNGGEPTCELIPDPFIQNQVKTVSIKIDFLRGHFIKVEENGDEGAEIIYERITLKDIVLGTTVTPNVLARNRLTFASFFRIDGN